MVTIVDALHTMGVREDTLSDQEKKQLDREGYLPLAGIVSAATLEALRARIGELTVLEGADGGKEVHREAGTDRLSDLVNKGEVFEICFTHPRVLAAVAHVLGGDLKLSSLNARAALPGEGAQALHADWAGPVAPGDSMSATRSGCWTTSPPRMGPRGWCPAASAAAPCPRLRCPIPRAHIPTRCCCWHRRGQW